MVEEAPKAKWKKWDKETLKKFLDQGFKQGIPTFIGFNFIELRDLVKKTKINKKGEKLKDFSIFLFYLFLTSAAAGSGGYLMYLLARGLS